jgi:hypothetical protein
VNNNQSCLHAERGAIQYNRMLLESINPTKSIVVCFTKPQIMEPLNHWLRNIVILEARSCKYLIILRNYLSWAYQVNYTVKKNWKAYHYTMRLILEYVAA